MSSSAMAAHNNSSGSQYLSSGNGDIFSVSDNGFQVNNHTTVNTQPHIWPLVQELIDSKGEDRGPYRAILAKWLAQQPGQPCVAARHHHLSLLGQATPGTGEWILSKNEFKRWKDRSSPYHLLFMHGSLGSGKSMLTSYIIHHLETQYRQVEDTICVYLFFHEGDAMPPSTASIWKSLTLQLLRKQGPGGVANELTSEFKECLKESCVLPPSKHLDLFKAQAKTFKTVYLLIDGLDNCPNSGDEETQQHVLNAIKDLPNNVRTLFSSRTELGICGLETSQTLRVTPRGSDIVAYVEAWIKKDESLRQVLYEHKKLDSVTHSVTNLTMASGMFLLARLHLDALSSQGTWEGMQATLRQLPKNSKRAFEGAIQQITKQGGFKRDLARHVLTWVVHAKADLTVEQIQDSYAFHESNGLSWRSSRPARVALVAVCAGLVVEDHPQGTIRLVHESVKDYLKDRDIIYENADFEMARNCLLCLLADDSSCNPESPLLKYASTHWASHCPNGQEMDPVINLLVQKLFSSSIKLARAFKEIPDTPGRKLDGMTGLHAAIFYNLRAQTKAMIKSGDNLNTKCSDGQTALHWAVTLGRCHLVKHLVRKSADPNDRKGADPNLSDDLGETPMHKFLSGTTLRNLDIVQSLVQGGARLDIKDKRGLTPLMLAIRYGPTSVARRLILSQEDVNSEIIMTGWTSLRELLNHGHEMETKFKKSPISAGKSSATGWSPLRRAIHSHVHQLMQLLLNRGVDLNRPATTTDKWLPLIHAVKTGQANIVQQLLKRKLNPVNVNLRDPLNGGSPLWLAFYYKRGSIVRQLVESGARLNDESGDGWTPLTQAVRNNDRDLVCLLLKKGAQLDALDSKGWSALHYAIEAKNKDIIWLLLKEGASVKPQTEGVPTFLDLALSANDLSVAWLLHGYGAPIDAADRLGKTALHRACAKGSLQHARFLLDMGSKIDVKDEIKSTPLHDSVLRRQDEVVELLASRAPHLGGLDEQDDEGNTALMLATLLKKPKMMNSLLRHGASCDVQGHDGLTALHHAANLGFNDGLRLLVAKAGNVDVDDKKGYTALHHAANSQEADAESVGILISGGANPAVEQEDGYQPWQLAWLLKREDLARQLSSHSSNVQRTMGDDGTRG